MSKDLSGSGSSHQETSGASGVLEGELIEGQDLTTGLDDSLSGGLGDLEGANGKLGDLEESDVVGDIGDGNNGSVVLALQVLNNSRQGDGISGGSGLIQSLVNGAVELGISSSGQESVQLNQELKIGILSLGILEVSLLDSATGFKINTHFE